MNAIAIRRVFWWLCVAVLSISQHSLAQQITGHIAGRVVDAETGEPVVGANVVVAGSVRGAAADTNGAFVIRSLPPGEYTLFISAVSYARKVMTGVIVEADVTSRIDVGLASEAIVAQEVVVEGKAPASYEGGLLALRRQRAMISDGVSAEQIKRSGDNTAGDVLRRVSGISIIENKFVYVRGTGERYNRAVLNGAALPGAEPEKRAFAFDLLPVNLISHTVVTKSFTPDVPGDIAGGFVEISTVDFPPDLTGSVQLSSAFVGRTSFRSFSSYRGGSLDYLGIDDGTRSLPSSFPADLSDPALSAEQLRQAARSLTNVWSPRELRAPLSRNFSFSLGDAVGFLGVPLGYVTSVSYRTGFESSRIQRREFEATGEHRFSYDGAQSTQSTLWGGVFNLSAVFPDQSVVSFKNTYSLSAEDQVTTMQGNQFTDSGAEQRMTALRFLSRSMYSGQLLGEHRGLVVPGSRFHWRLSYSRADRKEPDYRRVTYARPIGSDGPFAAVLGFQANLKNGGRFYSDLVDHTVSGETNIALPFENGTFKVGAAFERGNRIFTSRLIGIIVNGRGNGYTDEFLYYLPLETIFSPENFRQNGFSIDEYRNGTNNYTADQNLAAGYVMIDVPVIPVDRALRLVTGVRLERISQAVHSLDVSGRKPLEVARTDLDILPSLNLTYSPSQRWSVRAAYARTLNRPELRELAPFAYFDFATQTSVRGNTGLQASTIHNFDLRLETFPGTGEALSLSLFHKTFINAIEKVVVSGSALGSERTYANSTRALNRGAELEGRLSLSHLTPSLSDFFIRANYTRVWSIVDVPATQTTQGRVGRPLQGQSPYTINLGLEYVPAAVQTSAQVLYHVSGRRIAEVATAYQEDVVEEPRPMLDLIVTTGVTEKLRVKLIWKDILARDLVYTQAGRTARRDTKNSTISAGCAYEF